MPEDLGKLADLKYMKFRDKLDRDTVEEEEKITDDFGKRGFSAVNNQLISDIVDLHINKIKKLWEKRVEIEKELILDRYGKIPNSEIERLKKKVIELINQSMENLKRGDYFGKILQRGMTDYIEERKRSFLIEAARDIDILKGDDELRLEKEKREHFSEDYVNSIMDIFRQRDGVNLHFKNRFGFKLVRLEQEGVIPEIVTPCETGTDFATKIALLANLIDWMDVKSLKSKLKEEFEGDKSITLLGKFLKQEFLTYDDSIIKNLRIIYELRDKKFPIHNEGKEIIDIFKDLGENYPPIHWETVWKKVLNLYIDSLKNLIHIFQ